MKRNPTANYILATVGGAVVVWAIDSIINVAIKHLKSALEPVFCPDCKLELQRKKHDIFICYDCHMEFKVTHNGDVYPLHYIRY